MEHAWRYFELHAQQRISVFNFFLATTGLVATGVGICFQQGGKFLFLSSILSLFLSLITFIFWKLDQRVSFLIKNSERSLETLERKYLDVELHLFYNEGRSGTNNKGFLDVWSYGRCFRISFVIVALLSTFSFIFSISSNLFIK